MRIAILLGLSVPATLVAQTERISRTGVSEGMVDRSISAPQPSAPAPPANLAAYATPLSVRLSWSPAGGATGYLLYRAASVSGPWVQITRLPIPDTSFTDTPVLPSTTFVYQVASVRMQTTEAAPLRPSGAPIAVRRAVAAGAELTLIVPGPTTAATTPAGPTVTGVNATGVGPNQLLVRWNPVEGVHHYFISQSRRLACPANANYNVDGLSQVVATSRWGPSCVGIILVHPVYRLSRFPSERDTTDHVGPGAMIGAP